MRTVCAFEHVSSLRNQYPAPSLKAVSDERLLSAIRETSNEWEADLEDLPDHGG